MKSTYDFEKDMAQFYGRINIDPDKKSVIIIADFLQNFINKKYENFKQLYKETELEIKKLDFDDKRTIYFNEKPYLFNKQKYFYFEDNIVNAIKTAIHKKDKIRFVNALKTQTQNPTTQTPQPEKGKLNILRRQYINKSFFDNRDDNHEKNNEPRGVGENTSHNSDSEPADVTKTTPKATDASSKKIGSLNSMHLLSLSISSIQEKINSIKKQNSIINTANYSDIEKYGGTHKSDFEKSLKELDDFKNQYDEYYEQFQYTFIVYINILLKKMRTTSKHEYTKKSVNTKTNSSGKWGNKKGGSSKSSKTKKIKSSKK